MFKKLEQLPFDIEKLSLLSENIFSGITPLSGGDAYTIPPDGIPFIRSGEINSDGKVIPSHDVHIIESIHNGLMRRSQLKKNDVLIAIVGATIGAVGIYESDEPANVNQAIAVVRLKQERVLPKYVVAFLLSSLGQEILDYMKRPVARANINLEEIGEITIPVPPFDIQKEFIKQYDVAREGRNKKLAQADSFLQSIDEYIIKQLGLTIEEQQIKRRVFGIKLSQINGAINAERYSKRLTGKLSQGLKLSDIADILEPKISPSKEAPLEEWDWIRIDDLPNQPLEVETIRTQKGSEINGSLFKVEKNDILLARLGPTILNAKFILCPPLHRRTVASGEFLVLRCKDGWDPNVVLWILRTKYYRDMMYSQARGGTPSRYRLNKDDLAALELPQIDKDTQEKIANVIAETIAKIKRNRLEANNEWGNAQKQFEQKLYQN
ncbi:MAG TPA: restriction endonuclease subunit S [Candidatus Kapabacteria bacterium]|nr:restriction endonuclease subunit S [Candidatus Kapabacteria bacterium]